MRELSVTSVYTEKIIQRTELCEGMRKRDEVE